MSCIPKESNLCILTKSSKNSPGGSSQHKSNVTVIVGAVLGTLGGLALIALAFFICLGEITHNTNDSQFAL